MRGLRLAALAALVAAAAVAGAETPSVLLSNAENLELYYAVDPPGLAGPDTSSAVFVGKVVSFFSETAPEVSFQRLEPLGVQRVEGLKEGTHVFVGFFVLKGASEFPVRVVRLQAGGGIEERLYTVYREPATVTAKVGRGRLASFAQAAPGQTAASAPGSGEAGSGTGAAPQGTASGQGSDALMGFWKRVEPIVTFTGAFEPETVVRQTAAGTTVIPFARATYWGQDGVRLRELRIARRKSEVVFRVQTFGSMSADDSLLLYFQEDRQSGKDNRLTIELTPSKDLKGGYAVLWRKGVPKPVIVGRFVQDGNVLMGRIRYEDASAYLDLRAASPTISVDVCTGHHAEDRRVYEEFYHATIRLDQVPVVDDESPLFL